MTCIYQSIVIIIGFCQRDYEKFLKRDEQNIETKAPNGQKVSKLPYVVLQITVEHWNWELVAMSLYIFTHTYNIQSNQIQRSILDSFDIPVCIILYMHI